MRIGSRVAAAAERIRGLGARNASQDAPGSPSETAERTRKRLQERVTAGVLFGLAGMITGTLSLYIAWQTRSEESAVLLSAYPAASPGDLTHAGFGVRVQLVNESLRPVIVQSASLLVGDTKISDATGYLEDPHILDRSTLDPAAITNSRLDFPLSLNQREGRSVAILMDVWKPIVSAGTDEAALNARNSLNQLLTSVGSLATGGQHRIELGLELAPGGFQRFPVRSSVQPGIYPEAIRDASAIQRQAPVQNWVIEPLVIGEKRLVGLHLRRRFAGEGRVDLVQLDVWKEGSAYHRTFTRPVVGQQAELFPLAPLPKGGYVATFRLAGTVVAYRSVGIPWSKTHCLGRAGEPAWCPSAGTRKAAGVSQR
jgi:hypothetical protein